MAKVNEDKNKNKQTGLRMKKKTKTERLPRNIADMVNAEGHISLLMEIMEDVRMGFKPDGDIEEDILLQLEMAIDSILYGTDFTEKEIEQIKQMVNNQRGVESNREIIQYWIDEGFLNDDEDWFGRFGTRD